MFAKRRPIGDPFDVFKRMGREIVMQNNQMDEFLGIDDRANDARVFIRHLKALGIVYSMYNTIKHHDSHLPELDINALITAGISSAAGSYVTHESK